MRSNSSEPLTNLPFPTNEQSDIPRIYLQQEGSLQGTWIDAINASEMQQNIDYIQASVNGSVKISSFQGFHSVEFLMTPEMPIPFIAQVGKGIIKYGKPFCVYFSFYEHRQEPEILKNFREDYRGCFDRTEDFIKEILTQEGFNSQLNRNNLSWKHLNIEEIIRDWFYSTEGIYRRMLDEKVYIFKRR
jgi:antirestriction protein